MSVLTDSDKDGDLSDETPVLLTYTSDYDRSVVARAEWKVGDDLGVEVDTGWVNYSNESNLGTGDSQIMSVIITLPE